MTKAKKLDSVTLFLAQVANHSEELALLLAGGPREPIEPGVMARALLSTSMLAQSASLMELDDFNATLTAFHSLLGICRDRNACCDDRLAQVTSELIEKEEQMCQARGDDSAPQLTAVVTAEEWQALHREVRELVESAEALPSVATASRATPDPQTAAPDYADEIAAPGETCALDNLLSSEWPLGSSLTELRNQAAALLEDWNAGPWDPLALDRDALAELRRRLFLVSFYAQSIQQILALKAPDPAPPRIESLAPVRCAMEDFSQVLCAGDERDIDIQFVGDPPMDSRLLSPVIRVLQNMIRDTYLRCIDSNLHIEIVVQEQNGGLFWSLKDNGTSRVSDSPVDREEYLAFYPSLKEVRRILGRFHSLLWVEPSDNKGTRFSFSTPESPEGDRFMVWSDGARSFAVIPSEVGDVLTAGEANIRNDERGEYLVQNGERVPLLQLGQLYEGAPSEGGFIILAGYLERRVAFHANGESRLATGRWTRTAVTAWKGLKGVVLIDGEKIPVIEADSLLARYIDLMNDATEQGVGGGENDNESDLPEQRMPVDRVEDAPAQPDDNMVMEAEVLVVERSEALRNTLAAILSHKHLRARLVGQVEDAISCLEQTAPSVIISEFRVPSMAAKVLVERLKAEGKSIPVLVTTTHQGASADLLVEKLGAAGYISKPLDRSQVLDRVDDLIGASRGTVGKA